MSATPTQTTQPITAEEARARLLDHVNCLGDEELLNLHGALATDIYQRTEEANQQWDEVLDGPNNPLVFTEEEGRARLVRALDEVAEGKTMSLEEFNAKMDALAKARVQG